MNGWLVWIFISYFFPLRSLPVLQVKHNPLYGLGSWFISFISFLEVKRFGTMFQDINDTCRWPNLFLFLSRLLWVLHQMFRRGAVCVAGRYDPLLLRRGPVLWMWPCGSHRHRGHPGNPLLQGHQWSCHADWYVSEIILFVLLAAC